MSFKRKLLRREMSHIEKTAQPYGNRNNRRNRYKHKARWIKDNSPITSRQTFHFTDRPVGVT